MLIAAVLAVGVAGAGTQDRDQKFCINALNRSFWHVTRAQADRIADCLKANAHGTLRGTVEGCADLADDTRLTRLKAETAGNESRKCRVRPDFAATGAATVNQAASDGARALFHDVFGLNLDAAVRRLTLRSETDGPSAGALAACQYAVANATDRCYANRVRAFNACKRRKLWGRAQGPPAQSAEEIAACLFADAAGHGRTDLSCDGSPKARDRISQQLDQCAKQKVTGEWLPVAFPGCPGATDTDALHTCINIRVRCASCRALKAADALDRDCDVADDGERNGSCPGDIGSPTVVIDEPAEGAIVSSPSVTVRGRVSDPALTVLVNGAPARVLGGTFERQGVPLAEGPNDLVARAIRGDGTPAGQDARRTVILDTIPPTVTITAPLPRSSTSQTRIPLTATVTDQTPVNCTVNGSPTALLGDRIDTMVDLVEGPNTIAVSCTDAAGNLGTRDVTVFSDPTPIAIVSVTPADGAENVPITTAVTVTFSERAAATSIDSSTFFISAGSDIVSGTIAVAVDGLSATLTPSAPLLQGTTVTVTVTAGVTDLIGNPLQSPHVTTFRTAGAPVEPGVVLGEVYLDTRSQPLPGATIDVFDRDSGDQIGSLKSDDRGRYFLKPTATHVRLAISKAGHVTVHRRLDVSTTTFTEVLDGRLTPLGSSMAVQGALGADLASAAGDHLAVPPGAFAADTSVTFTSVSEQGPSVPFPVGWSPVAIVDVRTGLPVATPLQLTVMDRTGGAGGRDAVLARLDEGTFTWVKRAAIPLPARGPFVVPGITDAGQWALLLPDLGDGGPSIPDDGAALPASADTTLPADAVGNSDVTPPRGRADDPTPAQTTITLQSAGHANSGTPLRGTFVERILRRDGSVYSSPDSSQDLIAYRSAAHPDGTMLIAHFPITASRTFGLAEVTEGTVTVDTRAGGPAVRGVVGPDGGGVVSEDGNRVIVPPGAFTGSTPVSLASVREGAFPITTPNGLRFLGGLRLDVGGATASQSLTLVLDGAGGLVGAGMSVVVAEVRTVFDQQRLVLAALTRIDGTSLVTVDKQDGVALPGIRREGRYAFYLVNGPVALVGGSARDADGRRSGHLVEMDTLPFVSVTDDGGRFVLVSRPGPFVLTATGAVVHDQAGVSGTTGVPVGEIVIGPTPPRVVGMRVRAADVPGNFAGPIVLVGSPAPVIDDAAGGNGDGVIESGETIALTVTVRNDGTIASAPGFVLLDARKPGGRLDVSPRSIPIAELAAGAVTTLGPYTFTVPRDVSPAALRYSVLYTLNGGLAGANEVPFRLPLDAATIHVDPQAEVQIEFSEPVLAANADAAIGLLQLGTQAGPVAHRVFFAGDGRTATLRPTMPLAEGSLFEVEVTGQVVDRDGRSLADAPFKQRFRTRDGRPPAAVTTGIDASVPDANGVVHVHGGPGTVPVDDVADAIVIVLNETTGVTVLATVSADGSFTADIVASPTDSIVVLIRDRSGNETRVPLDTLFDRDPLTGDVTAAVIGARGGAFTSADGVSVTVPAGAFAEGRKIAVSLLDEPFALPADIAADSDAVAAFDGAFSPFTRVRVKSDGPAFAKPIDLAVVPPDDAQPGDLYVVVVEEPFETGGVLADLDRITGLRPADNPRRPVRRLRIIESATVKEEAGRLVLSTDSPPFPGITDDGDLTFLKVLQPVTFFVGEVRRDRADGALIRGAAVSSVAGGGLAAFAGKTDDAGKFLVADSVDGSGLAAGDAVATRLDVFDPRFERMIRQGVRGTVGDGPVGTTVAYLGDAFGLPTTLPAKFGDVLGDLEPPTVSVTLSGDAYARGVSLVGHTLTVRVSAHDDRALASVKLELSASCGDAAVVPLSAAATYTTTPGTPGLLTFTATAVDQNGTSAKATASVVVVGSATDDRPPIPRCGPTAIDVDDDRDDPPIPPTPNGSDSNPSGGSDGNDGAGTGGSDGAEKTGPVVAPTSCVVRFDSNIRFSFSESIDRTTVTPQSVILVDPEGRIVPSTTSAVRDGQVIVVDPWRNLRLGAAYEVFWTEDLTDLAGEHAVPGSFRCEVLPPENAGFIAATNVRDVAVYGDDLVAVRHPNTRKPGDFGSLDVYRMRSSSSALLARPSLLASTPTYGQPWSVTVRDSTAYVANQYLGELATFTPLFTGFGFLGSFGGLDPGQLSSVTGVMVARNLLPDPPSNIEAFDLCSADCEGDSCGRLVSVDRAALSKNEDVNPFRAFTDPTAWNLNALPIRVESAGGLIAVVNSHENVQYFDPADLALLDTIEHVGGPYVASGRCAGGPRAGLACSASIFELGVSAHVACPLSACDFRYEFINAVPYDRGYAVAAEKHGLRLVDAPVADDRLRFGDVATYRQNRQLVDQTLVPHPPALDFPVPAVEAGVPILEGASDVHWLDDARHLHSSDFAFVATVDGALHVFVTFDVVDGTLVHDPTMDPIELHPIGSGAAPLLSDAIGFNGSMAFERDLNVLYVHTRRGDLRIIDFNDPTRPLELNDPGADRSRFAVAPSSPSRGFSGVALDGDAVFLTGASGISSIHVPTNRPRTLPDVAGSSAGRAHPGCQVGVDLSVDMNRDRRIAFTEEDHTDENNRYRFWLNNDRDVGNDDDATDAPLESECSAKDAECHDDDQAGEPDGRGDITSQRDLEDFSPLGLRLTGPDVFNRLQSGDLDVTIEMTSPEANTPKLALFRAVNRDGFFDYLESSATAARQVSAPANRMLGTVARDQPYRVDPALFEGGGAEARLFFLFEALEPGFSELVVVVRQGGREIKRKAPVALEFRDITQLYEHYTVGDTTTEPLQDTYTLVNPPPTGFRADPHETPDYVLFVHGWRIRPWERRHFYAETGYKRLFWQGYRGRYAIFTWPTRYTHSPVSERYNFNTSEEIAWNAAPKLLSLLRALDSDKFSGRVRVFAHSMGNVVVSEALRLQYASRGPDKIVHTYAACQAAIPAHAYDADTALAVRGGLLPGSVADATCAGIGGFCVANPEACDAVAGVTPDDYRRFCLRTPEVYAKDPAGAGPVFKGIASVVRNGIVNFCNRYDKATSDFVWEMNQALKPAVPLHYDFRPTSRRFTFEGDPVSGAPFRELSFRAPGSITPIDDEEIHAYGAQPRSRSLGAECRTGGEIARTVDLNAPPHEYGGWLPTRLEWIPSFPVNVPRPYFDKWDSSHSAEWHSTNARRRFFWSELMDQLALRPAP